MPHSVREEFNTSITQLFEKANQENFSKDEVQDYYLEQISGYLDQFTDQLIISNNNLPVEELNKMKRIALYNSIDTELRICPILPKQLSTISFEGTIYVFNC